MASWEYFAHNPFHEKNIENHILSIVGSRPPIPVRSGRRFNNLSHMATRGHIFPSSTDQLIGQLLFWHLVLEKIYCDFCRSICTVHTRYIYIYIMILINHINLWGVWHVYIMQSECSGRNVFYRPGLTMLQGPRKKWFWYIYIYTLQGTNISHLGKRNIIFKVPFWGDMLVPWRVYIYIYVRSGLNSHYFRKIYRINSSTQ